MDRLISRCVPDRLHGPFAVLGVFVCYLLYGYAQEYIFLSALKTHGWFVTLVQFFIYVFLAGFEMKATQQRYSNLSLNSFTTVAMLGMVTMSCSNVSLTYLNFPTQVVFKCCKPLPVMIGSIVIQRKRYSLINGAGAVLICLGLILYLLADSSTSLEFNSMGVLLILLALCADAVIGKQLLHKIIGFQ